MVPFCQSFTFVEWLGEKVIHAMLSALEFLGERTQLRLVRLACQHSVPSGGTVHGAVRHAA